MDRRTFIGGVVGGLLAAPLAAGAQQAGKVYRIGYLSAPTRESVEQVLQAFLRTLRELGWVEGQNLIIEYRWAEGKIERLPTLAAELVQLKVDVIAGAAARLVTPKQPLKHFRRHTQSRGAFLIDA